MRTSELHHERHELQRLVAALVLVLCICVSGSVAGASAATKPGIDLRLDFETGDGSQFSGFECPHPGIQFGVYDGSSTSDPAPRQGRFAARFSESAADVWPGNDMVRCLGARYDSGESAGDDRYYALSVYIPAAGMSDNLLWELHHPSSVYNLPGCGVAPLALVVRNGRLAFRIATGNCTVGSGYAYWQPGIELPGLQSLPRSTWVDVVMHIVFSERDGRVELWYRTGTEAFPALPQLARYGIPTLPFADSAGVHDVTLYTELGLYPGRTGYASSDSVYLDGYRRGSSMDAVLAEFPGAGAAATPPDAAASETPLPGVADPEPPAALTAPAISGTAVAGHVLTASTGTWSGESAAYTYQWQWSRDRHSTWRDVTGATQPDFDITPLFVGAEVRVIVTAANASGSESAASAPVSPVAAALAAPSALVPPVLSGTPVEGEALTASSGVWAGDPTGFAYQWQWSRDEGGTWFDVPGATQARLDVAAAFIGGRLRVVVTGLNAAGSGTAASEPVLPESARRGVACRRPWAPTRAQRRDDDHVFLHDDW
jgi:hypothetical protein